MKQGRGFLDLRSPPLPLKRWMAPASARHDVEEASLTGMGRTGMGRTGMGRLGAFLDEQEPGAVGLLDQVQRLVALVGGGAGDVGKRVGAGEANEEDFTGL